MNEKIIAVQKMQDYIEEHLNEEITLADLGKAACFSPWYSSRIFKSLTGLAPADYIRRMRLTCSAKRLREQKTKIADEAFEAGFNSVDGYSRAFFREFALNPSKYASKPVPIAFFTPYGVKFKELWRSTEKVENVNSVFISVVEKPQRKVIIKRGVKASDYWEYSNEVGCDIWGVLTSMCDSGNEPVCMWLTQKYIKNGTSLYVQGVEVEIGFDSDIPEGFDVITLPAAKYLAFQGEPFREEDYCQAIEAVHAAIERYDPKVIGYSWDAENPRIQLEPIGERGYIELKAVK